MKKEMEKQKKGKKRHGMTKKLQAEKLEEKMAPYIIFGGPRRR